jgi:hypothetical protein
VEQASACGVQFLIEKKKQATPAEAGATEEENGTWQSFVT